MSQVTVIVAPGALSRIDVTPSSWSGKSSDDVQFTAIGFDADDNEVLFPAEWSTDDPLGSITALGHYTAGKVGSWIVICENSAQTVSKSIPVSVSVGDLDSIRINPSAVNLTADESITFQAVGLDLKGNEISIIPFWSVSGGGLIDNSTGEFEAVKVGSWFVYADYSGISSDAVVNITNGALTLIHIFPQNAILAPTDQQQYSSSGADADGNTIQVSPVYSATGGGIINPTTGLYTAQWAGTWIIYANQSGVTGSTTVKIIPGILFTITISPQSPEVVAGDSVNFEAEGKDSVGNVVDIHPFWEVDGGGKINTVSGLFTAERVGGWTVSASVGEIRSTTSVFVLPGAVENLRIDPTSAVITTDEVQQFNASGIDIYKNKVPVNADWTVDGGGKIDSTGLFTPNSTGKWTVFAEYKGIKTSVTITVNLGNIKSIRINPSEVEVAIGKIARFTAIVADAQNNSIEVKPDWSIDQSAGFIGTDGVFNARKHGVWNLSATYQGNTAFAKVTITLGEDTDGDGLKDKWEVDYGLDPLRAGDAGEDIDNDDLSNLQEFQNGTNPLESDSDSDGMDDFWELLYGLNPVKDRDAGLDMDKDGFTNLEEYDANTDPTDSTQHPPVKEKTTEDAGFENYFLIAAIIIIVIIILAVIITWAILRKRRESDLEMAEAHRERRTDIIDADFEMESDFEEDFEFEEELPPPPPPPPPSRARTAKAEKRRSRKPTRPKPKGKKKKGVSVKRKPYELPEGVNWKKVECQRCSEPIKVPYSKEPTVSLKCLFCGGKGKIDNPYLDKREKRKKKKKVEEEIWDQPEDEGEGISWDEEAEDESIEEDEVSWDDHKRYRGAKKGKSKSSDIVWDDEEKPYSKASEEYDDDLEWD
jgi:hypothetical protein